MNFFTYSGRQYSQQDPNLTEYNAFVSETTSDITSGQNIHIKDWLFWGICGGVRILMVLDYILAKKNNPNHFDKVANDLYKRMTYSTPLMRVIEELVRDNRPLLFLPDTFSPAHGDELFWGDALLMQQKN